MFYVFNAAAYEKEKDVEIKNFLKYTLGKQSAGQFTTELNEIVERMRKSNSLREEVMFISDEIQYNRRKAREEGLLEGNREDALRMLKVKCTP